MRPVILCALLVAAWALTAMGLPLTVSAEEGNEAGLVVQFGDGRMEIRCITFEEEVISGAELLARSGLDVVLDPASSMGVTVCQIEGEGCEVPAEDCFCQCMGGGECAYWNYFYRDDGEGEWAYSALGAALRKAGDGSVEAWVWGDGGAPPSNDLRFETICAEAVAKATNTPESSIPVQASALQATAENQPATRPPDQAASGGGDDATSTSHQAALATSNPSEDGQSPTRSASPPATPDPAYSSGGENVGELTPGAAGVRVEEYAVPGRPLSSPDEKSGSVLEDYWPFGLVVVALAVVGLVVWRRQR